MMGGSGQMAEYASRMRGGSGMMGGGYAAAVSGGRGMADMMRVPDGGRHGRHGRSWDGSGADAESQEEHHDSHADGFSHPVPLEAHPRRGTSRRIPSSVRPSSMSKPPRLKDMHRENAPGRDSEEQLGGDDSQRRGNRESLQAKNLGAGSGDHQGPDHACRASCSGRSGRCRACGRAGRPSGARSGQSSEVSGPCLKPRRGARSSLQPGSPGAA